MTHGGMMRCLMEYVLKAGQCSGLFANLAIPYAAIMMLDVYWLDIYWLDVYWLDDIEKLDCFQSVVIDSKVAKVSIT
ncbi:MAG: alpha-ribazole phosphatase [Shewanella psychromarinicola]